MKTLKACLILAASAAVLSVVSAAHATTIDFSTVATGTAVTTQYAGVSFSLAGGPGPTGAPVVGPIFGGQNALGNSTTYAYPTANIIDVAFTSPASGVSFTFDNWGTDTGAPGTSYTAFDGATIVGVGDLSAVQNYNLVNVAGSGITLLQIDNGYGPTGRSWLYGIGELTFTSAAPGPVPGAGLAGLAALALAGLYARARRA